MDSNENENIIMNENELNDNEIIMKKMWKDQRKMQVFKKK